ncbi:sensor histidine kinase [Arsukibacterium indicum]|uniref:histidine kinase n=1 Tax=Arsukibacterium indicum TaxID=2848612 RepID=A0ABS6ML09_9GAMM|nr:ATP-binding protein [Arsukibacterium indicum]MBV2129500.1 PAS domain S-box protein [Arsukibacterium indicum]
MLFAIKQHINTKPRFWYLLLGLFLIAAVGLNFTRLPLFFSVEFIFGSTFAVLALLVLGRTAAVLVGMAAAAVTLFIWNHPYAFLVFTAEIIWLCWRWRREKGLNLVQQDLLFWVVVGVPAVTLFYTFGLNTNGQAALLIALKQMTNGMFNTLLASLVILLLQSQRWASPYLALPLISLRQLLFHILIALTLFAGCVPLLLDARKLQAEYMHSVEQRLQLLAGMLQKQLQLKAQSQSANDAGISELLDIMLPELSAGLMVFDDSGNALGKAGTIASVDLVNTILPDSGFFHWQPEGVTPLLKRWQQSRFILVAYPSGLTGIGAIVIEQSATEVMARLEHDSARQLILLVSFLLLVTVVANWLSKAISVPLHRLALASEKLKTHIAAGSRTEIPPSNVAEYDSLARSLSLMSNELLQAFTLSKANESELSQQVAERTLQLQQSNSQLEAILAAASDFSIIATAPDGIITYFSYGAEKLLGYRAEELVNKETPALLHVADEVQQRALQLTHELKQPVSGFKAFVVVAEQKGSESWEWHYVRKDGQKVLVQLTVTPIIDGNNTISGYLGIAKDISERKRNEQLKNEFISTVSHELRTPLTSIYGSLRIVNSGVLAELPPKVDKLLQVAEANSQRLTILINDLLDMEKLLAGKVQLNMLSQPMLPLVQEALQAIQSYADQYQVKLSAELASAPLYAAVDAARVIQILHNLLSNAIKFSAEGSTVVVRLIQLRDQVKIEVIDQGLGIPDDFKSRIFDRFSQSDAASNRQHGGTGLGLAISKELALKMGGEIGFNSQLGQGSTFWLTFSQTVTEPAG